MNVCRGKTPRFKRIYLPQHAGCRRDKFLRLVKGHGCFCVLLRTISWYLRLYRQSFPWKLKSFPRQDLLVDKLAFFFSGLLFKFVFNSKKFCKEFTLDITNEKLYSRKRNCLKKEGLSLFFFPSIFNEGWTLYNTCKTNRNKSWLKSEQLRGYLYKHKREYVISTSVYT